MVPSHQYPHSLPKDLSVNAPFPARVRQLSMYPSNSSLSSMGCPTKQRVVGSFPRTVQTCSLLFSPLQLFLWKQPPQKRTESMCMWGGGLPKFFSLSLAPLMAPLEIQHRPINPTLWWEQPAQCVLSIRKTVNPAHLFPLMGSGLPHTLVSAEITSVALMPRRRGKQMAGCRGNRLFFCVKSAAIEEQTSEQPQRCLRLLI